MYIIAGLGNPGRQYEDTRHNVGFHVIDCIANKNNINVNKIKFKGLCGEGLINGEKVLLLKPQTFMNLSGQSILDAVQFYKIDVEKLIVIYDEMNLPIGRIRIRPAGSDGGHNGMKSIIYLMGQSRFPRVRIGIGSHGGSMVNHVIGRFSSDETKVIDDVIRMAAESTEAIIEKGIQQAMNQYNSYKHESITDELK